MVGRGDLIHNLYILDVHTLSTPSAISAALCGSLTNDGNLWHQCLGHQSSTKLQILSGIIPIPNSKVSIDHHCLICLLDKQKRLAFPFHNHMSSHPFGLVHLNISSPCSIESVDGYIYFLILDDDCTTVT